MSLQTSSAVHPLSVMLAAEKIPRARGDFFRGRRSGWDQAERKQSETTLPALTGQNRNQQKIPGPDAAAASNTKGDTYVLHAEKDARYDRGRHEHILAKINSEKGGGRF